ncbi:MAG TPA: gluconate 2-dehydrogenase subunit 3 family protein [Vicinamibacterales bacterium]|nr:gluconate 2-dehydrogenase subunit 3 family protein [Vicinamibacterales bacterium]
MSDLNPPTSSGISRRTALRALGAGAGAAALLPWLSDEGLLAFSELQRRPAPPKPKVIPLAQFGTLEALVEAILPADERSPGARDARVAYYIDLLLSESDEPRRAQWLTGLTALDAEATSRFGVPFGKLDAASTDTLMTAISRNESAPVTPLETFFNITKQATIHGYYTSEIGIHKELRYKGNQMLVDFVGCQTVDGKDCPHCGQKAEI